MGPLPTGRGGTHFILAVLDIFSKHIRPYALKRATTTAILNRLITDYIPRTGKPKTILSDNGTQFTAKLWVKTLDEMKIQSQVTTR